MLELSKVFIYFLIQQAAVVIFSLARSKTLATFTGVSGYGLLAQAGSLVLTLQVIFGAGLGSGFVKLIAENLADDKEQVRNRITKTMYILGSVTGIAGVIVTVLFSKTISGWIFGTPNYVGYVLICVLSAFFVFQTLFFQNLFRGLLEWKTFTLVSIIGTGVSLVATVAMIAFFNINGGVWALLVSQIGSVLVAVYFFWYKIRPRYAVAFWRAKPTRQDVRLLVGNIGPLVIIQIMISLSSLVTRSLVIQQLGLEENGFIQLSTGISDAYMGLIMAILLSYVLPKIAATVIVDPHTARKTQNDSLRFCLLIITPFLVALMAAREIWIPLLYSRAFLAAEGILVWQFMSDFFLVIRRCLNIDLLPTRRFAYLTLDGGLFAGGMILLAVVLLPLIGVYAVAVTSLILNLCLTGLSLAFHLRRTDLRLTIASWAVLAKSFALLCAGFAAALWIPGLPLRLAVVSLILVFMLVLLPQPGELRKVWQELIPSIIHQSRLTLHEESVSKIDHIAME